MQSNGVRETLSVKENFNNNHFGLHAVTMKRKEEVSGTYSWQFNAIRPLLLLLRGRNARNKANSAATPPPLPSQRLTNLLQHGRIILKIAFYQRNHFLVLNSESEMHSREYGALFVRFPKIGTRFRLHSIWVYNPDQKFLY